MRKFISYGLVLGTMLVSNTAFAQSATYRWSIKNNAPFVVYQYDVPTNSADISAPWTSPTSLSASGGTATASATATSSAQVATVYIGTAQGGSVQP